MAKYVIAGTADCPFYAKAELLADELASRLQDFKVHKIVKRPDEWDNWLKEVCQEKGWDHNSSPLIWRELVDRGGAGILIGGCNDFLEMAQCYYGITSQKKSTELVSIAKENLKTKEQDDAEEEERKQQINPLRVCVSGASSALGYAVLGNLVQGEIFGTELEIAITLLDQSESETNALKAIAFEVQDSAWPLLRSVDYTSDIQSAFKDVNVAILLDGAKFAKDTERDMSNIKIFKELGEGLEKYANKDVKVLIAGGSACLNTYITSKFAPSIPRSNFCALSRAVENRAKGLLAKKLNVNTAEIKDVIIWGDPGFNHFADSSHARVHGYDGAIWGPHFPGFTRPVPEMVHDDKWLSGEFLDTLKNTNENTDPVMLSSAATLTQLRDWWHGTTSDIWSIGVISEGWYSIPEGLVFSVPVRFEQGCWKVVDGLLENEVSKTAVQKIAQELDAEVKALHSELVK